MRRRIRLTGRRQLTRSTAKVRIVNVGERRLLTLIFRDPRIQKIFPADARVVLKLQENKFVEVVDFGTVGNPKPAAEFNADAFAAPTCQLRISATSEEKQGMLLGSTDSWTLLDDDEHGDAAQKGILLFQPAKIAPRPWKLDIREDDYPIIYIDERIPEGRTWARTDPIFLNSVLPAVLREIFDDILDRGADSDAEWCADWIDWADWLMPGGRPPFGEGAKERRKWTDDLIEAFCLHHSLSDGLVRRLAEGKEGK